VPDGRGVTQLSIPPARWRPARMGRPVRSEGTPGGWKGQSARSATRHRAAGLEWNVQLHSHLRQNRYRAGAWTYSRPVGHRARPTEPAGSQEWSGADHTPAGRAVPGNARGASPDGQVADPRRPLRLRTPWMAILIMRTLVLGDPGKLHGPTDADGRGHIAPGCGSKPGHHRQQSHVIEK
jgi:hypothetical protein